MNKIFKIFKSKDGQSLMEFVIVTGLVGLIGGIAFLTICPDLCRGVAVSSFSVESITGTSTNKQIILNGYGD